jgi:3-keto-5-aminohexanoate cleavage enzyme
VIGTILTVAPTGAELKKSDVAALPITPGEIATTARACHDVGASVVHVHARDHEGNPTLDVGHVKETIEAIRDVADLIVQVSTGGAVSDNEKERLRVLEVQPDAASLTCGTVNFGDEVFENRWPFMVELYRQMRDRAIVPEFEIFDIGHITGMKHLLDKEGPPFGDHVHADLVMGVPGGMPGDLFTLIAAVQQLPAGSTFSATGIGRAAIPVMLGSLASGGHLRVGMEDTITLSAGQEVESNAQLVSRAAELSRMADRPPLSTDSARLLLSVGTPSSKAD